MWMGCKGTWFTSSSRTNQTGLNEARVMVGDVGWRWQRGLSPDRVSYIHGVRASASCALASPKSDSSQQPQ